jgi:hypothetical protein
MYPSADLCRTQQSLQLGRAAAATLGNVRSIAERAAAAWGVEAAAAEDRERRLQKRINLREAQAMADGEISENPDRGRADS